jgi:hypothetical protein
MTSNLKKLVLLVVINLLTNSILFSQRLILNKSKDTTICFSLKESKYLLAQCYKVQKCDTVNTILEKEIEYKKQIIQEHDTIIKVSHKIIVNQNEIIRLKQNEVDALNVINLGLKDQLKKQKTYKRLAIITGVVLLGLVGFVH